ncbi:hypothetical protein [Mycolicibacter kumamotonensis]|uniref:Lipoprotein LpqJ n=1 Tax=Mycolicibacter kumamotonensis TaxID=354243 RepID=A0A1B8SET0_9MYCO|nr:hypothetical protein [Mycolicibacter kumamotonensis]OBY31186.1 hypothetical protein ACT18_13495 [Mycolicibacter kumamotonensis]ORA80369.1 hypothetical protein BST28_09930 [Mycolicibacter kumamotonensis]
MAALLLAGCTSTIDGDPTAAPGGGGPAEPSFRTPRPTTAPPSTPAPSKPPPASTPNKPGDAIFLPPDDKGYVFIETKSGRTRCQISTPQVDCEAEFTNTPLKDGQHANGVSVSSDGTVQWVLGNLGDIPVVTIDYLTYVAQGWTIKADIDGTRFTNERTGHGMFVSIDDVETF